MNSFKPIMTDYHLAANYSSNGVYERNLKNKIGIKTNEDYRSYLMNNANKIIKKNQLNALSENVEMTFDVVKDKKQGPYLFYSLQENTIPQGYSTNETKQSYLSRKQLEDLKFNTYKKNVNV